jgi:PilZ domain
MIRANSIYPTKNSRQPRSLTKVQPCSTMDRRSHLRFDLRAPVAYTWKDEEGIHQDSGITRDVSQSGLFIIARSAPPMGASIRFEVSFLYRDQSQIKMRARGRILRVESNDEATPEPGFATATNMLGLDNLKIPAPRRSLWT